MDSNSGYVLIPADSPLLLWMTLCDAARGLASCAMAAWFLARSAGPGPGPGPEPPDDRTDAFWRRLRSGVGLLAVTLALVIQFGVLENRPHVDDEIIQDWQARLLASGRVRAPDLPDGEAFAYDVKLGYNGRHLFSTYQPALAFLWAYGTGPAAAGLVNPALLLLALILCRRAVAETTGSRRADLTVLLLGLSPFAILMAGGRMNHLLALTLTVAVWRSLPLALCGKRLFDRIAGGLLGGLAAGFALMTRRPDALALIVAMLGTCLSSPVVARRRGKYTFITIIIISISFYLQAGFVRAHVGDVSQLVWQVRDAVSGAFDLGPGQLLGNVTDNLLGFSAFAWGGGLAGWAGLAFLAARVWMGVGHQRRQPAPAVETARQAVSERFLAVHALLTTVGYAFYYFQDFCYGPRYLFCLLPAAAYGWACLFERMIRAGGERTVRSWGMVAAALALATVTTQTLTAIGPSFWHIDTRFERFVAALGGGPKLLLLRHPARVRLEVARRLSTRGFDREAIAAAVSRDTVDYDGLRDRLDTLPAGAPRPVVETVLAGFLGAAAERSPEQFAVNPWEAVRLNGHDSRSQRIVIAIDRGDAVVERLMKRLPDHEPLLAVSRPEGFGLASYTPSGVAWFDREPPMPGRGIMPKME
mgnify:CR=1 FL=1